MAQNRPDFLSNFRPELPIDLVLDWILEDLNIYLAVKFGGASSIRFGDIRTEPFRDGGGAEAESYNRYRETLR